MVKVFVHECQEIYATAAQGAPHFTEHGLIGFKSGPDESPKFIAGARLFV